MRNVNAWIDPRIIDDMVERTRMSKESERLFRYHVRLYANHLESRGVVFESATADDVQLFFDHMTRSYASSTASGALSSVKRLHRWVESSDVDKVGLGFVRPSRTAGSGMRKVLSPSEARAVMSACETKREAALISLLMEAALKSGEVGRASVGDVTFLEDCAVMIVGSTECKPESVLRIPEPSAAKLRRYLDDRTLESADEPLFTSESTRSMGKRLSDRSIREIVKGVFSKAGIPGTAGDYDMRKTALLLARDAGADDDELVRFARLRSMSTVRDADNLYRYASDGPQEQFSRVLNGLEGDSMSYVATAAEIRRELEGLGDDEIIVVTINDGVSLIFEPLGRR